MKVSIKKIMQSVFRIALFFSSCTLVLLFVTGPDIHCHGRGKLEKALSDIIQCETACANILLDAECENLNQLFDPVGVAKYVGYNPQTDKEMSDEQFGSAVHLYTVTMYFLLRTGHKTLGKEWSEEWSENEYEPIVLNEIVRAEFVSKLADGYIKDCGKDPWGNLYNFWIGPWSKERPIPFRIYKPKSSFGLFQSSQELAIDELTLNVNGKKDVLDEWTDSYEPMGFPAPSDKIIYIWSNGSNLISDQAISLKNPDSSSIAESIPIGFGADDINNWDEGKGYMKICY